MGPGVPGSVQGMAKAARRPLICWMESFCHPHLSGEAKTRAWVGLGGPRGGCAGGPVRVGVFSRDPRANKDPPHPPLPARQEGTPDLLDQAGWQLTGQAWDRARVASELGVGVGCLSPSSLVPSPPPGACPGSVGGTQIRDVWLAGRVRRDGEDRKTIFLEKNNGNDNDKNNTSVYRELTLRQQHV